MLKLETPTGSVELSAAQERAVRSMTDADVCRELNRGRDPFVFAALKERPQIQLHPSAGWIYGAGRPGRPARPTPMTTTHTHIVREGRRSPVVDHQVGWTSRPL